MSNIEALDRHELPIQSVQERDWDCTATIPVHLSIFGLPSEIRTDLKLISDATGVLRAWFNDDMEKYLDKLRRDGDILDEVRGYEKFRDDWSFTGTPDNYGFLNLTWAEAKGTQHVGMIEIPTILMAEPNGTGGFILPRDIEQQGRSPLVYRSSTDPDLVNMCPEKMRQYGVENDIAKTDLSRGTAQVMSTAFCADYQPAVAQALLLRNFSVLYLNRLLEVPNPSLH
jgi:hypothetical protein